MTTGPSRIAALDRKVFHPYTDLLLHDMGPDIQWVQSYVTNDKIYCIYRAPNEEMVREHATRGGFPANSVAEVKAMIDPTTAE
jgi:hypothetical protein